MKTYRPMTVAFKLGWNEEERARAMLEAGASVVVVNTPPTMGAAAGSFRIMTTGETTEISGTKEEVAAAIWSRLL